MKSTLVVVAVLAACIAHAAELKRSNRAAKRVIEEDVEVHERKVSGSRGVGKNQQFVDLLKLLHDWEYKLLVESESADTREDNHQNIHDVHVLDEVAIKAPEDQSVVEAIEKSNIPIQIVTDDDGNTGDASSNNAITGDAGDNKKKDNQTAQGGNEPTQQKQVDVDVKAPVADTIEKAVVKSNIAIQIHTDDDNNTGDANGNNTNTGRIALEISAGDKSASKKSDDHHADGGNEKNELKETVRTSKHKSVDDDATNKAATKELDEDFLDELIKETAKQEKAIVNIHMEDDINDKAPVAETVDKIAGKSNIAIQIVTDDDNNSGKVDANNIKDDGKTNQKPETNESAQSVQKEVDKDVEAKVEEAEHKENSPSKAKDVEAEVEEAVHNGHSSGSGNAGMRSGKYARKLKLAEEALKRLDELQNELEAEIENMKKD